MRLVSLAVVTILTTVALPAAAQVQRTLIHDVRPGPSGSAPWRFTSLGDTLLFIADSTGAFGPEIWGTDGREAWHVFTPPDSTIGLPRVLGRLGAELYFLIDGALWFTDGVTADTVHTGVTSARRFFPCGDRYPAAVLSDRIVFAAGGGCQLWAVDRDSSWAVADPQAEGGPGGVAQYMFEQAGSAYIFWGFTQGTGRSVFRASGEPGVHTQVLDPEPDSAASGWNTVAQYVGAFYFASDRGTTGDELWRWTGSGNPQLVVDLAPGAASSEPRSPFLALGRLFFQAFDPAMGLELRAYDGSEVTTPFEIAPGPGAGNVTQLNHREASGALYFWVRDGLDVSDTFVLHSWDGTTHRTISTGLGNDGFHEAGHVVGAAGRAWFDGCDLAGTFGASLWQTDGTTASVAVAGSPDVCTGARPFMAMAEADEALVARIDDAAVGIEPFLVRPAGTVGTEPGRPASALAVGVRPNPIRGDGAVVLTLAVGAAVRVEVFDLLGRRAAVLHDGALPAGRHALRIDAAGLVSGPYVVRAVSEAFVATARFVRRP